MVTYELIKRIARTFVTSVCRKTSSERSFQCTVVWFQDEILCKLKSIVYFHLRKEVLHIGPAVAQAVRRWLPTAAARVRFREGIWGLWWTKRQWGRFSPSTFVSPANHSTNFFIIIITWGWHWWTQCRVDWTPPPPPPLHKLKKVLYTWKPPELFARNCSQKLCLQTYCVLVIWV
jgi:hypothetical protein